LADLRVSKYAKILVEHSARVKSGDRILLEGTTAAEPLLRELYVQILEKGGQPHLMMALPGTMPFSQDEMYLTYASDAQLDFVPTFYKLAYEQFEGRVRIHSATNTKGTTNIDPAKSQRRVIRRFLHYGSAIPPRRRRLLQMGVRPSSPPMAMPRMPI
jgi:aminopeptidase